jgi:hypothetical protein
MNKPPDETLKQGRHRSWLLVKFEVRRMGGYQFPFSFGGYIAKVLLGAVDLQMDLLDEPANNN